MADTLNPITALGDTASTIRQIGQIRIVERFDVALAALAIRSGRAADATGAANAAGVPMPAPARWQGADPYCAFWVAPETWFIEAPFASHEDIAAHLKPLFGETASITEQTDAWVRFDLSAGDLAPLMERLCNLDFPAAPAGFASRSVIEHTGCYVVKHGTGDVTLYGPRSGARSLLHALETAAEAVS